MLISGRGRRTRCHRPTRTKQALQLPTNRLLQRYRKPKTGRTSVPSEKEHSDRRTLLELRHCQNPFDSTKESRAGRCLQTNVSLSNQFTDDYVVRTYSKDPMPDEFVRTRVRYVLALVLVFQSSFRCASNGAPSTPRRAHASRTRESHIGTFAQRRGCVPCIGVRRELFVVHQLAKIVERFRGCFSNLSSIARSTGQPLVRLETSLNSDPGA